MDKEITPVVFRVWRGDRGSVIALFPTDTNLCMSYEHIGQHSGAYYAGCIQRTRPAKPAEYADLKRELESAPFNYRLRVYARKPVFGPCCFRAVED